MFRTVDSACNERRQKLCALMVRYVITHGRRGGLGKTLLFWPSIRRTRYPVRPQGLVSGRSIHGAMRALMLQCGDDDATATGTENAST